MQLFDKPLRVVATSPLLFLLLWAAGSGLGPTASGQPTGSSVHWQVCTDNQCASCLGNETVIGCFPKPQDNSSSQYDCVSGDKYVQISEYYNNPRCGGEPSFTPLIPTGQCAASTDGSGLFYRYTCQPEPLCTIRGVDWSGSRTVTWRAGVNIPGEHDYFWTLNFCENVTSTCTERPAYLQQVDATDGFCCKMFQRRNGVTAGRATVAWHLEDPFDNNPSQATVVVLCDPTTNGQIRPTAEAVNVSKTGGWTVFNLTVYSSLACAYGQDRISLTED